MIKAALYRKSFSVTAVIILAAMAAIPSLAQANAYAWGSGTRGYVAVDADCIAVGSSTPCAKKALGFGTQSVGCTDALGGCSAWSSGLGGPFWTASVGCGGAGGGASVVKRGGGNQGMSSDFTRLTVTGSRSGSTMSLGGSCEYSVSNFREVAVVRYTGDPNAFNSQQVKNVADMIAKGLISPGDVLFQATNSQIPEGAFAFSGINVTGLSDDQILVLGDAHATSTTVPMTTPLAALALAVVLLTSGLWVVRRYAGPHPSARTLVG